MSEKPQTIETFVAAVRRRKTRHQLWSTLIWAVAFAAGLTSAVGLCFVLRGYALPGAWIGWILGSVLLAAAASWALRRLSVESAAHLVDRFFQLQDAVTSYLHFSAKGRRDGYYALQAQQTAARVADLDAAQIRYRPPRRLALLAAGLVVVAIPISLCPPSDEVLKRLAMEELTQQETAAINEALLKEADKLIEDTLGTDEEKLLEPNKLRRLVEQLKATPDRNDALRQYAKLERQLDKARLAMQRMKDEQLLDRAAKELADKDETKPMAELLEQKRYDKAAEKLKELQPDKTKSPDQQRRDMARLKAITQRMAAAARTTQSASQNRKPGDGKQSKNAKPSDKQGTNDGQKDNDAANESDELDSDAKDSELAETIIDLADALAQCEKLNGDCEKVWLKLDPLADGLKKLALCRRCDSRLAKLCRRCSECQSNMSCESPNAGGLKAGWGSNTARRDQRDPLKDNGQNTQLKGIRGQGPSITSIEAASEGTGVSNRQATARERTFKRQCESFVEREDVPEAVKDGVKQYFQIIHENDTQALPERNTKQ